MTGRLQQQMMASAVGPHGGSIGSALRRQLRTPTVAVDVGGLTEPAFPRFQPGDDDDRSRAIQPALDNVWVPEVLTEDDRAVDAHQSVCGDQYE
jgi:hypothetical protein